MATAMHKSAPAPRRNNGPPVAYASITPAEVLHAASRTTQVAQASSVDTVHQKKLNPATYRSWSDIQKPMQFRPPPTPAQHRSNLQVLADYVARNDQYSEEPTCRFSVAGARTVSTRVVTGPNWVAQGQNVELHPATGYRHPESASSRRWTSRDARGFFF